MKFAYADPPYPGQAKRWYGNHPDYAGEVDHAELIARLERDYPDGWALSTDGRSCQFVLSLCPEVRVAVWHRTNAAPPGGRAGWWWDWEPVIVRGGRSPEPVRTVFASGQNGSAGRFPGSKPPGFTRWVLAPAGLAADDWPPVSYRRLRSLMDHGRGERATGPCQIPGGCTYRGWRDSPLSPLFVWDHCHLHDYVRGQLCRYHNVQMGHLDRYAWQSFDSPQEHRDYWARCPGCAAYGPWHPIMVQLSPVYVRHLIERAAYRQAKRSTQ